jgi:hypothetical protein
MSDIETHPRLLELIGLAKDAAALRSQMRGRNEATTDVDDAIDAIYADIGRLVFRLINDTSAPALPPGAISPSIDAPTFIPRTEEATQSSQPTEEDDEERESWYTEEVYADSSQPLFSVEDRLDELTDVPESDPISEEVEIEADSITDHEDFAVMTLRQLLTDKASSNHALNQLADSSRDPTWAYKLTQLLALLERPESNHPDEIAIESSRLQWAASEMGTRLDGLPESVQVCIIGMLAARAQHLRTLMAVDVGARLALDRIRRYRIDAELPTVAGLLAQPAPETGSWTDDIQSWWDLLHPTQDANEMDT